MELQTGATVYSIQIPSDLEYIPPLRQFIAEIARVEGFSKKFCFRSEIIVDELVTNGILHGARDVHSSIRVSARFDASQLNLWVQDQGGPRQNIDNLKRSVYSPKPAADKAKGRGLTIVQMLASEVKIDVQENGNTQVHVVKSKNPDDLSGQKDKSLYESEI